MVVEMEAANQECCFDKAVGCSDIPAPAGVGSDRRSCRNTLAQPFCHSFQSRSK